MEYTGMTLLELKILCKERGLIVSGKKDDVIIRLMENDDANSPPSQLISNHDNQYIHHNAHQVIVPNDKDVLMILWVFASSSIHSLEFGRVFFSCLSVLKHLPH